MELLIGNINIYLEGLEYQETCKERNEDRREPGQYELVTEGDSIDPEEVGGEDDEGETEKPSNIETEVWEAEL